MIQDDQPPVALGLHHHRSDGVLDKCFPVSHGHNDINARHVLLQ
ncbi:hypothetical protein QP164_16455 [Sphingomonas sp. LR59]